jgi:hypothetical protein
MASWKFRTLWKANTRSNMAELPEAMRKLPACDHARHPSRNWLGLMPVARRKKWLK